MCNIRYAIIDMQYISAEEAKAAAPSFNNELEQPNFSFILVDETEMEC